MVATITASEAQRNFGEWHDRALNEPVRITKHGRETLYLISAETYRQLWSSFRKAIRVEDLSDAEMKMIMAAEIPLKHAYELDQAQRPKPSRRR